MPIEVYFRAQDGTGYRIYDTTFTGGTHHQRALGDPTATARVFVPKDVSQMRRSYTFKARDTRVLDDQALERQLREASYVGNPEDTSTRRPR